MQQTTLPDTAANEWLQREAADVEQRVWTAYAPPLTSAELKFLQSGLLNDIAEALAEMDGDDSGSEDGVDDPSIESGPVGYDRLPQELIEFILKEFHGSPFAGRDGITKATWRIVQDRLYPHFDASRMNDADYQEFLATLAMYHAFQVNSQSILNIIKDEQQILGDMLINVENLPESESVAERERISFLLQKYANLRDDVLYSQKRVAQRDESHPGENRGR